MFEMISVTQHSRGSFVFTFQHLSPISSPPTISPLLLPWTHTFLPSTGDSAVSVGERVPGARVLSPPHGPGGALPVARPDDALSLGQHHRPREAGSVSPGLCHWPQVSLYIYFTLFMRFNRTESLYFLSKWCCWKWLYMYYFHLFYVL